MAFRSFFQADDGNYKGMSPFLPTRKLFSVHFSVINYLSGRRNLFAYKLEGFVQDWFYSRQIISSRLSPIPSARRGNMYQAKSLGNNNGQAAESLPDRIFVHITLCGIRTWWAKMLYVLFYIFMDLLTFYFNVRAKY